MSRAAAAAEALAANLSAAVYGTITVGALLAAESARRETYAETVGAVLIALLLYWLAHAYAEFASWRLANRKPLTLARFGRTLVHEAPILAGALLPLLVLVVGWAAGATLDDAVTAAVWTSAAMIAALEIAAGVRAHETRRELAVQTLVGIGLGLLVLALKLLLHG